MPKLKSHQGAKKRIKITNKKGAKLGKMLKGSVQNSHLFRKETVNAGHRKKGQDQVSTGFVKRLRKLLAI